MAPLVELMGAGDAEAAMAAAVWGVDMAGVIVVAVWGVDMAVVARLEGQLDWEVVTEVKGAATVVGIEAEVPEVTEVEIMVGAVASMAKAATAAPWVVTENGVRRVVEPVAVSRCDLHRGAALLRLLRDPH